MTERTKWSIGDLSWNEFFQEIWAEVQQDDLFGKAAQLGFYFLLALFPALLCITALIGFLPIESMLPELMAYFKTVLPSDSMPLIEKYVEQVVAGSGAGILSLSFLGAFWAVSTGMAAIIDTLNGVYNVDDSRSIWKARGIAIILTIGVTVFVILSLSLILGGAYLSQWIASSIGSGVIFTTVWAIIQWPLVIAFMLVAVSMIYYMAPNVAHSWRVITPGSGVAVTLWMLSSLGFKYYVENFGTYNIAYGSLAGIIVLMLWLYISGLVLLIGGEVDAVLEKSARDQTVS